MDIDAINERFQEIKELAWKREKLPKDKSFTITDEHYFQCMKAMYEKHRMRLVQKKDAELEVEQLRLRFVTDKSIETKRTELAKADKDRHMRAGQIQARLIKDFENMSSREIFSALFFELVPLLTDEVTGKKIREGAALKLWTGVSGLSPKEAKEILKANGFQKGDKTDATDINNEGGTGDSIPA